MQDAEERRLSLDLIGSLLSGNARFCELRENLAGSVFGEGHYAEGLHESLVATPTVKYFVGDFLLGPDVVCVGTGACGLTLSPWSCPLPLLCTTIEARRWIGSRADADNWLMRLSGKTLACNCTRPSPDCWARILTADFADRFEEEIGIDLHVYDFVENEDIDNDRHAD